MAYHPFRHLGLKFVSLVLAVLLWMTVAREPTVERNMRVPLHFQNMPEQLQVVGEPPSGVDVRVRGSSGLLSRLEEGDVVAILDLESARAGFRMFNLFTEHVRGPLGVSVEQVLTPTVPLEFERIGVRVVPVVPTIEGDPARGFQVGQVSSDPESVEVLGPESRLRQVIEATTEPVSVDNVTQTVEAVVTVGVPDPALRLREARTATVTVEIAAGPVARIVTDVPVQARRLGPNLEATLASRTVTLVIRGRRERVDDLSAESMVAYVELEGLEPGDYDVTVQAPPLADVMLERIEPSEIRVQIK